MAIVQRFGAALNLNVHIHALLVDGVFAEYGVGTLVFRPAPSAEEADLEALVAMLARRIHRLLARRRVLDERGRAGPSRSVGGRGAAPGGAVSGVRAGPDGARATGRRHDSAVWRRAGRGAAPNRARAVSCGVWWFDLDATVRVPAGARDHLERICRYALRPPIAQDRTRLTAEGDVLLELRHRWSDGTTHLRSHPLELLERLASLTPQPRINLVLHYGVFGAHAAWRRRLPRPGVTVATAAAGLAGAWTARRGRGRRVWKELPRC